jgi:hypothetical protein
LKKENPCSLQMHGSHWRGTILFYIAAVVLLLFKYSS